MIDAFDADVLIYAAVEDHPPGRRDWLASRDEDVYDLTETKASDGYRLLADTFRIAGYAVIYPEPGPGEYGTMIVSKGTCRAR